ncbi:MAG: ABC transporter permease [Eubacteriales bacterium]|nr:ABC transporter permease [Eubacteriales bacterium]HBR32507.1 ABC transporter [Clostridiales bacterium]
MTAFIKRVLKVYFRDKTSVFFSLLAVFIIIGLYVFFLGDVWSSNIQVEKPRLIMDSWIMSGLLAVVSLTTTMGAFGIMVDDRHNKITKDFYSSPIKRSSLTAGYIGGAFLIGLIMSVLTFILVEIYIVAKGGTFPDFTTLIKIFGLIILSTLANTTLLFFIVSFLKSQNAFGTASSVVGTLVGFITGIYMPIGILPDAVQIVVKIFPVSHSAVLFRQVMMESVMNEQFGNAPAEFKEEFAEEMGIVLKWGDTVIPSYVNVLVILATAVLFYLLSIRSLSRKSH